MEEIDLKQSRGALRITAERIRQVEAEGWTPQHDARHSVGEIAHAGMAYAEHAAEWLHTWGEFSGWSSEIRSRYQDAEPPACWPWGADWWKPKDPARDLERAGALMAAEIDRAEFIAAEAAKA